MRIDFRDPDIPFSPTPSPTTSPDIFPQTFLPQTSPFFTEKGLKTGACPGICKGGPNI